MCIISYVTRQYHQSLGKGSNHTCNWCSNHASGDLMQCSFVITVHLDEFQKCLPQERLLDDKASDAVTRQQTVYYSGSQKWDKLVYCLTVRIWQSNHKRPYTEHLILNLPISLTGRVANDRGNSATSRSVGLFFLIFSLVVQCYMAWCLMGQVYWVKWLPMFVHLTP